MTLSDKYLNLIVKKHIPINEESFKFGDVVNISEKNWNIMFSEYNGIEQDKPSKEYLDDLKTFMVKRANPKYWGKVIDVYKNGTLEIKFMDKRRILKSEWVTIVPDDIKKLFKESVSESTKAPESHLGDEHEEDSEDWKVTFTRDALYDRNLIRIVYPKYYIDVKWYYKIINNQISIFKTEIMKSGIKTTLEKFKDDKYVVYQLTNIIKYITRYFNAKIASNSDLAKPIKDLIKSVDSLQESTKAPESHLGDEHEEDTIEKGSRVISTYAYDGNQAIMGIPGTVIDEYIGEYAEDNKIKKCTVQFDRRIPDGHKGHSGNGKYGYCWNIPKRYLIYTNKKMIDESTKAPESHLGDEHEEDSEDWKVTFTRDTIRIIYPKYEIDVNWFYEIKPQLGIVIIGSEINGFKNMGLHRAIASNLINKKDGEKVRDIFRYIKKHFNNKISPISDLSLDIQNQLRIAEVLQESTKAPESHLGDEHEEDDFDNTIKVGRKVKYVEGPNTDFIGKIGEVNRIIKRDSYEVDWIEVIYPDKTIMTWFRYRLELV